jgi:hypothetical protein
MVGALGEVQVMDWGFARFLAGDGAAAGNKNAAHVKTDTDLDALRGRANFRALLTVLEGGKQTEK